MRSSGLLWRFKSLEGLWIEDLAHVGTSQPSRSVECYLAADEAKRWRLVGDEAVQPSECDSGQNGPSLHSGRRPGGWKSHARHRVPFSRTYATFPLCASCSKLLLLICSWRVHKDWKLTHQRRCCFCSCSKTPGPGLATYVLLCVLWNSLVLRGSGCLYRLLSCLHHWLWDRVECLSGFVITCSSEAFHGKYWFVFEQGLFCQQSKFQSRGLSEHALHTCNRPNIHTYISI